MIVLNLPFPPSVNHYWRNVGSRVLISQAGRDYQRGVQFAMRVLAMAQGKPEATLAEVVRMDKYRNAATAQTPGAA